MAIQYVGGQTASITVVSPTTQTITYSLTGGLASVPAAGDLVIVGYGEAAGGDAALSGRISTSGYSLITELYSNDSQDSNLAVFRKFMGGTPDSNISVIGSTSTNSAVTVNIQVWRGVDTTTPLDPTTTTATGINTGYANPAAITPAATDNVIALFANTATSNNDSSTYTTASTSYMTNFRQVARAGNSYRSVGGSGYVTGQSAGVSYDPAAWVVSSDSVGYSWCAATLALRPAPAVIDGDASGNFDLTGASTGTAIISGAASGTLDVAGVSSGTVVISGTSAGSISLTGTASATAIISATATGSISLTGAASAATLVSGTAAGTLPLTGAASAATLISGTAAGTLPLTGTSSGMVVAGAGLILGTAAGSISLTGAASAATLVSGAAAGSIGLTGAASATARISGAAAGSIGLTGAASATARISGTAAGSIGLTGAAIGGTRISGMATGSIDLTGAAIGIHASRSRIVRLGVDSETEVALFSGAETDVLVYTGGGTSVTLTQGV